MSLSRQGFYLLRHRQVAHLETCCQWYGAPILVPLWHLPGSESRALTLDFANSCFPVMLGKQEWDEAGELTRFRVDFPSLLLLMALVFFKELSSMVGVTAQWNLLEAKQNHFLLLCLTLWGDWHSHCCVFSLSPAMLLGWTENLVL